MESIRTTNRGGAFHGERPGGEGNGGNRQELARALKRLQAAGVTLDGASDHGVSEALYLRDPDGNGIELYCDRNPAEWPHSHDGMLAMYTEPLDLDDLLAEA